MRRGRRARRSLFSTRPQPRHAQSRSLHVEPLEPRHILSGASPITPLTTTAGNAPRLRLVRMESAQSRLPASDPKADCRAEDRRTLSGGTKCCFAHGPVHVPPHSPMDRHSRVSRALRPGSHGRTNPRVFCSYAHEDSDFVDAAQDRLKDEGFLVWVDRISSIAGPLQQQVVEAIAASDVVLVTLSRHSVKSDWVEHEIRIAHDVEITEDRCVLCPVALDDSWKSRAGDVFWRPLFKYNVLDFSEWKEADTFKAQFERLMQGIRTYYL